MLRTLSYVFVFQLTTSRGGRLHPACHKKRLLYFNSRPHEEVDPTSQAAYSPLSISTHDLTRRSTMMQSQLDTRHTYFNSRPHEEVDIIPYLMQIARIYFNSRPHEEVDWWLISISDYESISTHDLTRRSTTWSYDESETSAFQLTTSRGGRQRCTFSCNLICSFQLTTSRGGRLFQQK